MHKVVKKKLAYDLRGTMSARQFARRTGLSLRQIQYWDERGYFQPLAKLRSHRWGRRYSETQVREAKILFMLRAKGIPISRAARLASLAAADKLSWIIVTQDEWYPGHTVEDVAERLERLKVPAVVVRVG